MGNVSLMLMGNVSINVKDTHWCHQDSHCNIDMNHHVSRRSADVLGWLVDVTCDVWSQHFNLITNTVPKTR